MRRSENHKKNVQLFVAGADYDINPEISGMKQGFYRDANNMRIAHTSGDAGAAVRIKGEDLIYSDTETDFTCIGGTEVNYHLVEIWVRHDNSEVRFRINGELMLNDMDNKMKLSYDNPLQLHKADDCNGGEIYFTDFVNPPYIFSIQDIIDNYNSGSDKYFDAFDPFLYQTLLKNPPHIPKFIELTNEGGTSGLRSGTYAYSIRYVDESGNRTKFSPPTPLIPVMASNTYYEGGSEQYNNHRTYDTDLSGQGTPYGIKLNFRVDNVLNYKYIEVRRIGWRLQSALGYTPIAEYYQIPQELVPQEVTVWEWIDKAGYTWLPLTDEEDVAQMSSIETAKAIRYFQGHLTLGNIKYSSRDLEGKIKFLKDNNGYLGYPFLDYLGKQGHADAYNSAYKSNYMSGERYGFGLACYDSDGNVGLVVPIDDGAISLKNYQFPNRRHTPNPSTYDHCINNWKGMPRTVDINNNVNVYTFERFEKRNIKKTLPNVPVTILKEEYNPLVPKTIGDTYAGQSGHQCRVNKRAITQIGTYSIDSHEDFNYNPDFGVEYYTMGIAINGVDINDVDFPSWVTSFSVVRTAPAKRVHSQGIVAYDMKDIPRTQTHIAGGGNYVPCEKNLDSVVFYSDDIENGFVPSATISLKMQCQSPVGFFSEMYHNEYNGAIDLSTVGEFFKVRMYNRHADMVLYARESYTDPSSSHSPHLYKRNTIQPYWTRFGEWRNDSGTFNGDQLWDINNIAPFSIFKQSGRSSYSVITLDDNIYSRTRGQIVSNPLTSTDSIMDCNHQYTQLFHEPFYIANMVNDSATVPENNLDNYYLTGHYQKIKSKIGTGNGSGITFRLIDERWEDSVINPYSTTIASDNKFVYVTDSNGVERRWLNITHKTAGDIATIISNLNTNGYHEVVVSGQTLRCYGVYKDNFVSDREYYIIFSEVSGLQVNYTLPQDWSSVHVKYDNRFPMVVFGGDSWVGDSMFALVDGLSKRGGGVEQIGNLEQQLYAWVGFPYSGYVMADDYNIMKEARQFLTFIGQVMQKKKDLAINIIRQMLVTSVIESRSHLPFSIASQNQTGTSCDIGIVNIDNTFPRVHYVMRPIEWDSDCIRNFDTNNGEISFQYSLDYPGEFENWTRGGLRFKQLANRDYSQWNSYDVRFSKPQVGFKEETEFCSRVLWSIKRNINEQDDPNLKTFLAQNYFDISDNMHEIKFLYDNNSEKGNNLIALTGSGVCLMETDKRIVSQIGGDELLALPADRLITGEYWLSKTIGCSGEMWRGIAEYNNNIFFPNSESVYRMAGMQIADIGRNCKGSYHSKLYPVLQNVRAGYGSRIAGVYNVRDNEYWLHINNVPKTIVAIGEWILMNNLNLPIGSVLEIRTPFITNVMCPASIMVRDGGDQYEQYYYIKVYSPEARFFKFGSSTVFSTIYGVSFIRLSRMTNETNWTITSVPESELLQQEGKTYVFNNDERLLSWSGTFDYYGDKFINTYGRDGSKEQCIYMMKNYESYKDNTGDYIGGLSVDGSIMSVVAENGFVTKEFIDQTFNMTQSPSYINYSNNKTTVEATQDYFKNYTYAWYCQIPRKETDRRRFQGQYLVWDCHCNELGDWIVTSVENGYKVIR